MYPQGRNITEMILTWRRTSELVGRFKVTGSHSSARTEDGEVDEGSARSSGGRNEDPMRCAHCPAAGDTEGRERHPSAEKAPSLNATPAWWASGPASPQNYSSRPILPRAPGSPPSLLQRPPPTAPGAPRGPARRGVLCYRECHLSSVSMLCLATLTTPGQAPSLPHQGGE